MLIIKAYLNHTLIDEIHIRKITIGKGGRCTYSIMDPPDYDDKIIHNRSLGWRDLGGKVLTLMATADERKRINAEYKEYEAKNKVKTELKAKMILEKEGGKKDEVHKFGTKHVEDGI